MTPRLVATDLDGTVVRTDGSVSPRTVAALRAVEDAGVGYVMVTGRPPRWMAPLVEATGHRGVALCANGAIVYDLRTEQVVASRLLSADLALDVAHALRERAPGVAFAVEHPVLGFGHEPAYIPRWEPPDDVPAPLAELVPGGVVKLLARLEGTSSDDLLAVAREVLGGTVEVTHSSDDGLLEISVLGVSKASALAELAADRGVAQADVVAFGDMPNDVPMISWAGHGVAMGNAHDEVVAVADEVTAHVDDDGVALVLERWFAPRVAAPDP